MIVFWVIIAFMIVLALAFVLLPLIRKSGVGLTHSHDDLEKVLYREHLQQLQAKLAAKEIDQQEYQLARLELDRSLLQTTSSSSASRLYRDQPSYKTALLLLIVFPVAALLLYLHWGASQKLQQAELLQKRVAVVKAEIEKTGSPIAIIDALKSRLQQHPQSARGWFLLGRLYMSNQQYQDAVEVFAKANQLQPKQPGIMVSYVQAQFFSDQRVLKPAGRKLIQQALSIQPNNINAINLLAVDAYNHNDYQKALRYWLRLMPLIPPHTKDAKVLNAMIEKAQTAMAKGGKKAKVNSIDLRVHVSLASQLKAKLAGQDSLFIYAQAVNGPPMPVAVVRKQVSDLPLTMSLDHSTAMLPG